MGKISSIVGKMPFAGKSIVENSAAMAIAERTSMREKVTKCAVSAGFLAGFAVMHGFQAKLGWDDLKYDAHQLLTDPTPLEVAETTLASAYTIANAAVTYTQLEISTRVGRNLKRFWDSHRHNEPFAAEDYHFEVRKPQPVQLAFTLGAQAVMLAQVGAHHIG